MNLSIKRFAPVGRRLVSKSASKSFGSLIARSTIVPAVSGFKYSGSASFSSDIASRLSTEITSEEADDELDHEYLDSKKQIEKLFTIHSNDGEG